MRAPTHGLRSRSRSCRYRCRARCFRTSRAGREKAKSRKDELLNESYAALAGSLSSDKEAPTRLRELLAAFVEFEDGASFVAQVKAAQRVFTK